MKYRLIVSTSLIIMAIACSPGKKVMYDFPETMSEPVKNEYIAQFNKGRILYDINCAPCHNQMIRGKSIIPDFTAEQLAGYEIRIGNTEHIENLTESKVTEDEIVLILTFLRYKKKSNVKNKLADTTRKA